MSFGTPFQPGREKTGGRQKGTRNKISEAFLKDLHAEWERSGAATLKILAVENPAALAALVAKVISLINKKSAKKFFGAAAFENTHVLWVQSKRHID